MRAWFAALVLITIASDARAQLGVPVEPFILTTPDYRTLGQSIGGCNNDFPPPNRDVRRGSDPSRPPEQQPPNPQCPVKR
jgi:hypothetical protein